MCENSPQEMFFLKIPKNQGEGIIGEPGKLNLQTLQLKTGRPVGGKGKRMSDPIELPMYKDCWSWRGIIKEGGWGRKGGSHGQRGNPFPGAFSRGGPGKGWETKCG